MVLSALHAKIANLKVENPKIKKLDWIDKIRNSELCKIFDEEVIEELLKNFSPKE